LSTSVSNRKGAKTAAAVERGPTRQQLRRREANSSKRREGLSSSRKNNARHETRPGFVRGQALGRQKKEENRGRPPTGTYH